MRTNIYSNEVTDRVEPTHKVANTATFKAVRFFVGKPMEHTPGDDDTSAVTFFFAGDYERGLLREAFKKALALLDDPNTQW